jgi:subtilisin family serine protease
MSIAAFTLAVSFTVTGSAVADGRELSSAEAHLMRLQAEGIRRVIVKFTDAIDLGFLQKHCQLERTLRIIDAAVCEIPETEIDLLSGGPEVESVQPDDVLQIAPTTRNPVQVTLSYDGPVGIRWNNLEAGSNAKAAWDRYGLDGTGVKVAIIDTGIQHTLPDLTDNYLGGWDFVDSDDDPLPPLTTEYHGTEVATAGFGAGVSQVVGPAHQTGFYALRVFQGESPPIGLLSDAIAAIEWAMDPDGDPGTDDRADIIILSFSAVDYDPMQDLLEDACDAAHAAGMILVSSSGNDALSTSGWPASFANVIAVGAQREDQTIPAWSTGGVDVVAPGSDILVVDPDGSLWSVGGASYAVPQVSASLALQLQYARQNDIDPSNDYLRAVMENSAVDLGRGNRSPACDSA